MTDKQTITYPDIEGQIIKNQIQTSTYIREYFQPHFNLYQKTMLKLKIKCYEDSQTDVPKYYKCVDKYDQQMNLNSRSLQKKFGQFDIDYQDDQDKCKQSFIQNKESYQNCMNKCSSKLKDGCILIYQTFYDQTIKNEPEYKKISK